jgi:hypothetical protein
MNSHEFNASLNQKWQIKRLILFSAPKNWHPINSASAIGFTPHHFSLIYPNRFPLLYSINKG